MKRLLPKIALVMLFIGIIATILIPINEPTDVEVFKNHSEAHISLIIVALNLYHSESGVYPDNLEQLVPKYFNRIPKNYFDEHYQYYFEGSRVIVFTVNEFNPTELIYIVHNNDI